MRLTIIALSVLSLITISEAHCTTNEFQCSNGDCINKEWKCDNEYDCRDNSDEEESQCTAPPTDPFVDPLAPSAGAAREGELELPERTCNHLEQCKKIADDLGLYFGGERNGEVLDFQRSNYSQKGCYAYKSGGLEGHVFFGTGGSLQEYVLDIIDDSNNGDLKGPVLSVLSGAGGSLQDYDEDIIEGEYDEDIIDDSNTFRPESPTYGKVDCTQPIETVAGGSPARYTYGTGGISSSWFGTYGHYGSPKRLGYGRRCCYGWIWYYGWHCVRRRRGPGPRLGHCG